MPFDASKFVDLDDRIHRGPPTPREPERGGGPRQIHLHIHIQLVGRRSEPAPRPSRMLAPRGFGAHTMVLLVVAMVALALLHHAFP